MKKALALTVLTFALGGCVDLLNATIPGDGYAATHDIAYAEGPRHSLDIYRPDNPAAGSSVIVFYYGGRWETGKKEDYLFAAQAFASKGFTVVIADYRLYPDVKFPAFVDDAAQALIWTHKNIARYGGNPENIFVAGHSAGAYLALMLTANTSYIEKAGGKPGWIRGAIGLAGPYNFIPSQEDPDIRAMFGTAKDADTQPITFAHKRMPPVFLATGDADDDVKPHNTYDLAAKLQRLGDTVETRTYPGVAHIGLVLALADGFRGKAPVLEDAAWFVEKYAEKNN
jgi:acetyl esterase/lipase